MFFSVKKKKSFLIILLFFSVYLSANLCVYSKDMLPPITNGTKQTITFTYSWKGCGSDGMHTDHVSIASGKTLRFTRNCIEKVMTPYIAPMSAGGYIMTPLTLVVSNNKLYMANGNMKLANSAILKYNLKNTKSIHGYYWELSY